MEYNYNCNGKWFATMREALAYSGKVLEDTGVYRVVFTKAEMDSITEAIDHELECGK